MKNILNTTLRYSTPALISLMLAACGGSGGGVDSTYGGAASSAPVAAGGGLYGEGASSVPKMSSQGVSSSRAASSSPVLSSAAFSSASSLALSSVAVVSTKAPITKITNIGGTFVAEGTASVLLNTAGSLSVVQKNKAGMTLYVFDNDTVAQSVCVSTGCITTWPPLLADTNAVAIAPLTIIQRSDGHAQWALRDKPLYFFANDTQEGDIKGEGVGGVWHVAVVEPVALIKGSVNANDGDYFAASGSIMSGTARVNREGFSLYTFDNDTANISNCLGGCLSNWPALEADANDHAEAPYSIITRAAVGTNASVKQWAYQGKPLYFFKNDTLAGQTAGKAIPKWHLARPMPLQTKSNTAVGSVLAGAGLVKTAVPENAIEKISSQPMQGFTLYTFDNDTAGASNCTAACLTKWPALMANAGAVAEAPYSLVARTSGGLQWALNGKPLYFFAADTRTGDVKGEDVGGVWHSARLLPIATNNSTSNGLLFTAHGNLVNDIGGSDSAHEGFTLYTVSTDPMGQSTCNGGCLAIWPALFAAANAVDFGDFSVITRTGGAKQWAYKGKPLYFFSGDTAAGDVNGVYGTWSAAKP